MTDPTEAILAYLRQIGAGLDPDFLREAVRGMSTLLMEMEVKQQIGADRYERTENRTTIEEGEAPEQAMLRKAFEETGLTGLVLDRFLGEQKRDLADFGREQGVTVFHSALTQEKCNNDLLTKRRLIGVSADSLLVGASHRAHVHASEKG